MIQSMTGYGKTIIQLETKKISLEIKSLNSKNLDINTRFPGVYREKEIEVRRLIANNLVRGKVDMSFYIESTAAETSTKINREVVANYIKELEEIHQEDDLLSIAMRLPDVLKTEREELDPEEWALIQSGILEAIENLKEYRRSEGEELRIDFEQRIAVLKEKLREVISLDGERLEQVRIRLKRSIKELEQTVDENRFEQELIYYLEKLDITEEKVRLTNHLNYFEKELDVNISNGKKLGFISQEIGREINTIGSKANFAPMQKAVVEMKDELEKIKEQLLNVL
ncbi:YicC/YloC family endoribonuclease [Lutimonas vermicola]|uniref:YicC/YloC family endoribonuclease n=1 Tax=Lutimonas vermicola TaxID=414288 RepID=A0ABU9L344_9FLAO